MMIEVCLTAMAEALTEYQSASSRYHAALSGARAVVNSSRSDIERQRSAAQARADELRAALADSPGEQLRLVDIELAEVLRQLPEGQVDTYGTLARRREKLKAERDRLEALVRYSPPDAQAVELAQLQNAVFRACPERTVELETYIKEAREALAIMQTSRTRFKELQREARRCLDELGHEVSGDDLQQWGNLLDSVQRDFAPLQAGVGL